MDRLWEYVVRFRTWIVNVFFALMIVGPELLNSPEMLALIPAEYQRWVVALAFLANIWMRPRPAVIASDPEAKIKKTAG